MPSFSKTFTGLTEAASVVLHWRPSSDTAGEYLQYSNGHVNMNGTYTASFSYDYDVEYTWSLYYGQYGSTTTKIDGGMVYTASPAPQPFFTISAGTTTAIASISNLSSGDKVTFTVTTESGSFVNGTSGTASGSSMSLVVSGLDAGKTYRGSVTVDGASLGSTDFKTQEEVVEPSYTYSAGDYYLSVTFSDYASSDTLKIVVGNLSNERIGNGTTTIMGLKSGTEYVCYVYINGIQDGGFVFKTTGTATTDDPYIFNSGLRNSDGTEIFVVVYNTLSTDTATITVNGVSAGTYSCNVGNTMFTYASEPNSTYTIEIVIRGVTLTTTISTIVSTSTFEWDTPIYKGAKMNTYQYTGIYYPAPVTAVEWNRLVKLVNAKCGKSISTVGSGAHMSAAEGGNIRQVADALGVTVSSDDIITAQFFLDLRDAINAL